MLDDDKECYWIFIIEFEYGSGLSWMGWMVMCIIWDIYNFYFCYRFVMNNEKYILGCFDFGVRFKQFKFFYFVFFYL